MRECEDVPTMAAQRDIDRAKRKIARIVLDNFWLDMGHSHNSAAIQCSAGDLNDAYSEQARISREGNAARRKRQDDTDEARLNARRAA
jgi:hypothetical protein